jgi:hypothetical protein
MDIFLAKALTIRAKMKLPKSDPMQFLSLDDCLQLDVNQGLWMYGFTFCKECGEAYNDAEFCPVCSLTWAKGETKFMQCDRCQRWIHYLCTKLSAKELETYEKNKELKYFCHECNLKEISLKTMEFVDKIIAKDKHEFFLNPVTNIEGYDDFIRTPMCFTMINNKLCRLIYRTFDDFKADLNLVWRNCTDFWPKEELVHQEAIRLQAAIAKDLDKLGKDKLWPSEVMLQEEKSADALVQEEEQPYLIVRKPKRASAKDSSGQENFPPVVARLEQNAFFQLASEVEDIDVCGLCGSPGDWEYLLCCSECSETFHSFCLGVSIEGRLRQNWRCPNCVICDFCDQPHQDDPRGDLLVCNCCDRGCHRACAAPKLKPGYEGPFRCSECVMCECCGSRSPGSSPEAAWASDFTLCAECGELYANNSFCPDCDQVFRSTAGLLQCEECRYYFHRECDDLVAANDYEYSKAKKDQYHCRQCRTERKRKPLKVKSSSKLATKPPHKKDKLPVLSERPAGAGERFSFLPDPGAELDEFELLRLIVESVRPCVGGCVRIRVFNA